MESNTLLAILQLVLYALCAANVWMMGKQKGRREMFKVMDARFEAYRTSTDDLLVTAITPYAAYWKEHDPESYRKMVHMGYIKVTEEEKGILH